MYSTAMTYGLMDYCAREKSPFSTAQSLEEFGSGNPALSDSSGRSCSPPDMPKPTDTNRFQFDSIFTQQQSLPMRRPSVPYQRQQVSYLPETVNAAWPPLTQQSSAFNNPCPPKRYVFEAPSCCASPRIRVIHECCNQESTPREIFDDRAYPRRNYPSATKLTLCRFCLKNGEPPSVYYSHNLHHEDGRVSCPILRRYDCPICNNGGGDFAHTVRYCPRIRSGMVR